MASELDEKIVKELVEKKNDYETKVAWRLNAWVQCAEQVLGRSFNSKENFEPTVSTTELFKAIRAEANMIYRMLTSQRPFFQLEPLDILGAEDPAKLVLQEHYITQQMKITGFNRNLYDFIQWLMTYGTAVAHLTYEPVKDTFLGKKQYATFFRPTSLLNAAFALDNSNLADCGWVALTSVQPSGYLEALLRNDSPSNPIYKTANIKQATNDKNRPDVNIWTRQRLALAGYINGDFDPGAVQITTYYGPIDTIGDGKNYVCQFVNDLYLIRKELYKGLRPLSIATINTLDIEPLGNGLYEQFKHHLRQINDVNNDLINSLRLVGANMFVKQKSTGDEDSQFAIRNFGILELEDPTSLKPLSQNPNAIGQITAARELFKQEYRQGTGATDVLQAIVPNENVTATAASLSMNESVRNLSVAAECLLAEQTIGQYCAVTLENWHKYQTEPITVNVKGMPVTVMPNDMKINSNVIVKTMTDQDFRPAKLQKLGTILQLLASMPPSAINGFKINIGPTLMEMLRLLDVPDFQKTLQPITEEDLLRASITNQMLNPQLEAAQQPPVEAAMSPANRMANEIPGRKERRDMNNPASAMDKMPTPVGDVLTAPGDSQMTPNAIRSSNNG